MFSSSRKPYTAVTVQIERLTGPEYEVDDWSGIVDLIEVIRIQDTGPTEAARAIRKKLKYGTTHRQLRALTVIDFLIQNGGGRFQRTFADEPLLERLRSLPHDDMVDPEVRDKCNALYRQWATHYKSTPGLTNIAMLYKELPKKQRPTAAQSNVLRETERQALEDANPFHADEDDEPPSPSPAEHSLRQQQEQAQAEQQHRRRKSSLLGGSSSSPSTSYSRRGTLVDQIPPNPTMSSPKSKSKDKKSKSRKRPPFNLQQETPQIMKSIASSSISSTNLLNALKFINRESGELPSQNKDVMLRFETCKKLRREVLRYIQLVESEQWIGSLLSANDELVKALMAWEVLEKGVEEDSDSEFEEAREALRTSPTRAQPQGALAGAENKLGKMRLQDEEDEPPVRPPRPAATAVTRPEEDDYASESDGEDVEDDDDNPFGDHAAIDT